MGCCCFGGAWALPAVGQAVAALPGAAQSPLHPPNQKQLQTHHGEGKERSPQPHPAPVPCGQEVTASPLPLPRAPQDCAREGSPAPRERLGLACSRVRGLSPVVPVIAKASAGRRLRQEPWSRCPREPPAQLGRCPLAPAGPERRTALLRQPQGPRGSKRSPAAIPAGGYGAPGRRTAALLLLPGAPGNLGQGVLCRAGRGKDAVLGCELRDAAAGCRPRPPGAPRHHSGGAGCQSQTSRSQKWWSNRPSPVSEPKNPTQGRGETREKGAGEPSEIPEKGAGSSFPLRPQRRQARKGPSAGPQPCQTFPRQQAPHGSGSEPGPSAEGLAAGGTGARRPRLALVRQRQRGAARGHPHPGSHSRAAGPAAQHSLFRL